MLIDMSTIADGSTASCATNSESQCKSELQDTVKESLVVTTKRVRFPEDSGLVTESFDPANPWHDVSATTRAQLAAEYLESCRRHSTHPIDSVLQQIRELPEACIGGSARAPRLALADCSLMGVGPADALEAVLRKAQFRRLEIEHADIDDEGAEALFDMVEYYESAVTLSMSGPRQFGIRGWQAASRMIKKSAALSELEVAEAIIESAHCVVLSRSLRAASCRLCSLTLQHSNLAGEPLHTLLLALKSNTSVLELRLCDNNLTSSDAIQIASLLRANNTIQLLDLSNNHIMDAGAGHICCALVEQAAQSPHSPPTSSSPTDPPCLMDFEPRGLAYLVLWNNKLTKNCSYDISRAVSASRSLVVLNIGRNHVGGSLVFAMSVCWCGVRSLGLQACSLGPGAAAPLADLVANHTIQSGTALRTRLRSPAPSPACSPTPAHSRFTVSRVTPDRDSSTDSSSPTTPTSCNPPSRFRVVQVTESPKPNQGRPPIVSTPRNCSSRFSVTRNYDNVYNTALTPSPPPLHPDTSAERRQPDKNSNIPLINVTPLLASDGNVHMSSTVKDVKSDNGKSKSATTVEVTVLTGDSDSGSDRTVQSSSVVGLVGDSEKLDLVNKNKETVAPLSTYVDMPAKVVSNQNVKGDDDDCGDVKLKVIEKKDDEAIKQIAAITEDLGHLIQEMKDLTVKSAVLKKPDAVKAKPEEVKVKIDDLKANIKISNDDNKLVTKVPVVNEIVLKKNKSESSLDSPDLEVSRLMNKKSIGSSFFDSSSSLEISESSVESLYDNTIDKVDSKPVIIEKIAQSDTELDRRKPDNVLSTDSSIESSTISDATPVNCANFLNTSISSAESVSPVNFSRNIKIHGSLSSLEASVSSLDSSRPEKVMLTSADSGIEYSLQNTSEIKDDSSNEGTLTNNSSLKETVKKHASLQDTLTTSKRAASLLDVPLKAKSLDRMRKTSWIAPSSSFHIPKPEPEKVESKLPSHLEKLLSIFHHPSSIFSRSSEEEKKATSNTPPRKDSSLTSAFWSWGVQTVEKEDEDSSPDVTDSTLSERIQVSFVDESFSKKLDSKTPSTDTDNTLSEFQSFPIHVSESEVADKVTTELVQIGLSNADGCCPSGGGDKTDLMKKPNDLNKDNNDSQGKTENDLPNTELSLDKTDVEAKEAVRPKSFAAVLKASGSENSQDKPVSPETGQPIDKLPSKVVRGIKENISPENTLTSSITITKALAQEFTENEVKVTPIVASLWDVPQPVLAKSDFKLEEVKVQSDLAPIANIDETCDEAMDNIIDNKPTSDSKDSKADSLKEKVLDNIDVGKDALSYLMYENQDFEPNEAAILEAKCQKESLAQELKDAELKENLIDLSPELVVDEKEAATATDPTKYKSVLPVKLKKSNSLEDLPVEKKDSPKAKTIAFKIPESTTPRDIPDRRRRIRSRTGSSPKSLPESLNKPCSLTKIDSAMSKKKKKVNSLGKIARDSLLALNMSEDEIAEFRRSYKLTSVESLRSLESVSEDANSQSGNSVDSRCRACVRTSQESLMSLDSITEDCKCHSLSSDKEHR